MRRFHEKLHSLQRILPGTAQQFPSGDRKVLEKKVCELFKREVLFLYRNFSLNTHGAGCGGGGGGVGCCVWYGIFSHKLVICTQSSVSDSRLQTLKWLIRPHKARLPLCLTTFYVLSSPSISDSCRCTIMSPPWWWGHSVCVFQMIMLLGGNGRKMRRGRVFEEEEEKECRGWWMCEFRLFDYKIQTLFLDPFLPP